MQSMTDAVTSLSFIETRLQFGNQPELQTTNNAIGYGRVYQPRCEQCRFEGLSQQVELQWLMLAQWVWLCAHRV